MLPDRYSVSLQGLRESVGPSVYGKQQKSLMKHTFVNSRYAHFNMPRVDPVEIGGRKTLDIRPNSVIFPLLPWFPIPFRLAFTFVSIIPAFRVDTNLQVSSLRFRVPSPKPRERRDPARLLGR